MGFLQEVVSRTVYIREDNWERPMLEVIDPRYVFYDISGLIEPGFDRRYAPVSDHLAPLLNGKLYPNEEESRYLDWFDFLSFYFLSK
jgi:hypothetical protein